MKILFLRSTEEETKSAAEEITMRDIVQRSVIRATRLEPVQIVTHDVPDHPPTPALLSGMQGIVIGGAKWSVWEDVPNQSALIETVKAAREKKIPILGICYGAQLLAHAFGGEVVREKPEHAEFGTFDVETTDDSFTDLLFADVPFSFAAQQAHQDRIAKLPPGTTLLASSPRCKVQAFVIPGTDIYGVQFHPERSKADYEAILALRGDAYTSTSTAERIRATLRETPDAESVIAKFVDRVIMRK